MKTIICLNHWTFKRWGEVSRKDCDECLIKGFNENCPRYAPIEVETFPVKKGIVQDGRDR